MVYIGTYHASVVIQEGPFAQYTDQSDAFLSTGVLI